MIDNCEQSPFDDGMNLGVACGAMLTTLVLGIAFSIGFTNSQWRQEAIKHGAAHYDANSGEFKWNTTVAESPK